MDSPNVEASYSALAGCRLLAADRGGDRSPLGFWGKLDCQTETRHRHATSGGDPLDAVPGYRILTAYDGDDIWGERCEVGYNDHRYGPTAFYREGSRRATLFSMRFPDSFPADTPLWQTIMQMKQAQPSNAGGGVPILALALDGADGDTMFRVYDDKQDHWQTPFTGYHRWVGFLFDVRYSQNPGRGWLQVSLDTDRDGIFDIRSPRLPAQTLKPETAGPLSHLRPGESIPSHLRMGVYHHPNIPCPAGCSIHVDNIRVYAPSTS